MAIGRLHQRHCSWSLTIGMLAAISGCLSPFTHPGQPCDLFALFGQPLPGPFKPFFQLTFQAPGAFQIAAVLAAGSVFFTAA